MIGFRDSQKWLLLPTTQILMGSHVLTLVLQCFIQTVFGVAQGYRIGWDKIRNTDSVSLLKKLPTGCHSHRRRRIRNEPRNQQRHHDEQS